MLAAVTTTKGVSFFGFFFDENSFNFITGFNYVAGCVKCMNNMKDMLSSGSTR